VTAEQWRARAARLIDGESVTLTVRRRDHVDTVRLTAVGPEPKRARTLGLTARTLPRIGAEIVRVAPDSAAFRAGLIPGDVITRIGEVDIPTAARLSREFAAAVDDRPVLAGVTRGASHFLVALERRW
jgi:membrane-associated protease RseP (regulator of RpoE activity)